MAVGEETLYSIIAPPEATIQDVHRMTVEVYLNEENPPELVLAEPLGRDPTGNSVWSVTVREGPESAQEATGGDDNTPPDTSQLFGQGGS